jgi:hypothetical protein
MDQQNVSGASTAQFNITDFEASDIAILDIQSKKGDGPLLYNGQPVRVKVRSPGTREALSAKHKADQATQGRMFAGMRGKPVKETIEGKIEERAEKLAAITVDFENFPASPAEVFGNPKMGWFTDQVEAFHGDWANF